MNKKAIGIIIVIVGAILLCGIAYILFSSGGFGSGGNGEDSTGEVPQVVDDGKGAQLPIENKKETREITIESMGQIGRVATGTDSQDEGQVGKNELKRMAQSFAERFGTYSNQSNFSNVTSLKIFMSQKMKQWADGYVVDQKGRNGDSSIYYGITTKAVSAEFKEYDDEFGVASVLVGTRRREATGTTNNASAVFSQSLLIKLLQEGGSWKVDGAYWQ